MPELPEVETTRLYVEDFCIGNTITNVITTEQGGGPRDGLFDNVVIGEGVTSESLKGALSGRSIMEVRRRGKQMWFVLDKPPHPLFHFGMTGAFTVKGEKRLEFCFKITEEWPPRFTKLELQMSNGTCLALTDPRRLARVRLREEPESSPPISLLGPDPVTHPLSLEVFAAALAKSTAPIKAVLLAQDRVVSGIGNWVSDEVCFQGRVHPGARCNTLSPEQVAALHAKLLSVCREACEVQADYTAFPVDWLFHHRWSKGKNSQGAPRVSSGDPVLFDVVGGRTTAVVPALQKMGLLVSPQSGAGGKPGQSSAPACLQAKAGGVDVCKGEGRGEAGGQSGENAGVPRADELGKERGKQKVKRKMALTGETLAIKECRARMRSKEAAASRKNGDGGGDGGGGAKGGGVSKKVSRSHTAETVVQVVKVEPTVANASGTVAPPAPAHTKVEVAEAASTEGAGRGTTTSVEVDERAMSSGRAPAKRGRGREEDHMKTAGRRRRRRRENDSGLQRL